MSVNPGIVLIKNNNNILVESAFPIFPNFNPFSILAITNGQTVFTLPSYPIMTALFILNINGVVQDQLNGDFTINGNVLTVNASLIIGDKLSGFYQAMSSAVNPSVLSYRSFFATATQNQTQFNIGFVPKSIIYVSVNGILQSLQNGDYSINNQTITMSSGLNAGDRFFGLAII